MKRVVVQVTPDESQAVTAQDDAMKLEATLSEENVQLVLETVLCLNGKSHLKSSDQIIEFLVRQELDRTGEPNEALFDRLMSHVERVLLGRTFVECDRVQTRTAERLGIDRNTLHKKLRKHNILQTDTRP